MTQQPQAGDQTQPEDLPRTGGAAPAAGPGGPVPGGPASGGPVPGGPELAREKKIPGALLRYRVLAWITGIWLLALCVELIINYGFGITGFMWIAVVHGWIYFVYLLLTLDLAVRVRWPILRTLGTLIAGTIPFLSFYVEHVNAQQVKRMYGI